MASLMPSIDEIYFASMVDKSMIDYKVDFQLIAEL